jgi:hypothetical protein
VHANGGTSETIKVHSDLGTGLKSIEALSDVGGVYIKAGVSSAAAVNIVTPAGGCTITGDLTITGTLNAATEASVENISLNNAGATTAKDCGWASQLLHDATGSTITQVPTAVAVVVGGSSSGTNVVVDGRNGDVAQFDFVVCLTSGDAVYGEIRVVATVPGVNNYTLSSAFSDELDDNSILAFFPAASSTLHAPNWEQVGQIATNASATAISCADASIPSSYDDYYNGWAIALIDNATDSDNPTKVAKWGEVTNYVDTGRTFTVNWTTSAPPATTNGLAGDHILLFRKAEYTGPIFDISLGKTALMMTKSDFPVTTVSDNILYGDLDAGNVSIGPKQSVKDQAADQHLYFGAPGEGQWRVTVNVSNQLSFERNSNSVATEAIVNPTWVVKSTIA